eukprot:scaffold55286_cov51-Phaeocystis_antarctica.AAC.1
MAARGSGGGGGGGGAGGSGGATVVVARAAARAEERARRAGCGALPSRRVAGSALAREWWGVWRQRAPGCQGGSCRGQTPYL